MMFRKKLACVMVITGLVQSPFTFAETRVFERSSSMTMSSLVKNVYDRYLPQQKERAQQQRIDANTEFANARFADTASINLEHYNDVIGSSDGYQEWQGSVDLPLWLPGQQQQQLALSQTLSAELPAYQQRLLLEASAKVRNVLWPVVLAETEVAQTWQTWQTAQDLEQNVASRVTAGELAGTEALLANSHALEMQSRYVQAQSALDLALASYQNQTGENALPENFEETLSTQTTLNSQHPYLALLDQKIATLRTKQELARFDGAINPNLSLGIRRERGGHDESFTHSVGVGISFALDDAVYRNSNIATAGASLADADIERLQLERELQAELLRQRHQLQSKQQQLTLMIEQEKSAQQYLLLQQRAFDLGEIDLVSLLRSQALANDANNRKTGLQIDIKHAISAVNQALGVSL